MADKLMSQAVKFLQNLNRLYIWHNNQINFQELPCFADYRILLDF